MALRLIDMIWGMSQSFELGLGIFRLEFISYSILHANFDGLNDISGQNPKDKSCSSMSLGHTLKISAS